MRAIFLYALEFLIGALGLQLGVEARLPREAHKEEPERGPPRRNLDFKKSETQGEKSNMNEYNFWLKIYTNVSKYHIMISRINTFLDKTVLASTQLPSSDAYSKWDPELSSDP